jgi:hypothetical protein
MQQQFLRICDIFKDGNLNLSFMETKIINSQFILNNIVMYSNQKFYYICYKINLEGINLSK